MPTGGRGNRGGDGERCDRSTSGDAPLGGDMNVAGDEHPLDLDVVVEDDDVGRQADVEPARSPRSPSTRAGTAVAASTASASGTPRACRFRTASIIVSTLPASTPSGPRTAPVVHLDVEAAEASRRRRSRRRR